MASLSLVPAPALPGRPGDADTYLQWKGRKVYLTRVAAPRLLDLNRIVSGSGAMATYIQSIFVHTQF